MTKTIELEFVGCTPIIQGMPNGFFYFLESNYEKNPKH